MGLTQSGLVIDLDRDRSEIGDIAVANGHRVEVGERDARSALRAQIARLERECSAIVASGFPHISPTDVPSAGGETVGGGPCLLTLAELERMRDRLAGRAQDLHRLAGERVEHEREEDEELERDLVRADLGLFNPKLKGEHISGKLVGHALLPYADRAAIDTAGLDAPILFYTDDVIAFFFLQIQGSGRVAFDDGNTARIVYAGENGQTYTAIGRTLIADGSLAREDVSLQSIRAWLLANPARAAQVMETNRSYIFFAETARGDAALGSKGFLGTSLTPLASLAVDSRLHALGAPFYVAADGPDPVSAVMVAQDIGGAIRGAVRGDIFFGFGAEAERRGGAMKAPGRLYLLLPAALAAKLGAGRDYPPNGAQ